MYLLHKHISILQTFILAHTGAACRREENFWRAREFIPERWVKPTPPHAPSLVAPFGRGRRMCPGKRFVDLELHLLLAKVCTVTDITLLEARLGYLALSNISTQIPVLFFVMN